VTGGGQELETVRRHGRNGTYLFILNHGSVPRTLRGAGVDLVTGSAVDGAITVAPRGVAVVRESGSPAWSVDPA
jgi:beta-galactosidase